jgi:tetratricopeptide (TPR) repeat protein
MPVPSSICDEFNNKTYFKYKHIVPGGEITGVASYSSSDHSCFNNGCQESYYNGKKDLRLFPGDQFTTTGSLADPNTGIMTFKGVSWYNVGVRGLTQKLIVEKSGKIGFHLARNLGSHFTVVTRAGPSVRGSAFDDAIKFVQSKKRCGDIVYLANGVIGGRVAAASKVQPEPESEADRETESDVEEHQGKRKRKCSERRDCKKRKINSEPLEAAHRDQRKAARKAAAVEAARKAAAAEAARKAAIRHNQQKIVADNLYRNGQYQRAVAEYGKIIKEVINNPRCTVQFKVTTLRNRSAALLALYQYDLAIEDCKSVLILCPPDNEYYGKTHHRLAGMYRKLEQWHSADSHYSACIDATANLVEKFKIVVEQNSCAAEKSRKEFKKQMSEQAEELRKTIREDRAKWAFGGSGGSGGSGGLLGNSNSNHRAVLGVDDKASQREIKSAYRKLARQFHPDKNSAPGARQRFDEVQAAYDALK